MLEQILSEANLNSAWKQVRANRGAAGVDGITIDDFPSYVREHWPRVKQALLDGSYQPSPVKRVEIPKRSGGKRPLGIPTVLDRLKLDAGTRHIPVHIISVERERGRDRVPTRSE